MIEINNISEISFDFVDKIIEVKLKKPVNIKGLMRDTITKKGTYEEYLKYLSKIKL